LKEFIDLTGNWILKNSVSQNLSSICNLIVHILTAAGFTPQFSMRSKFFFNLVEIFEEEIEFIEKNEDDPSENLESVDEDKVKLLTPVLASSVLSLFVSIMNK
jgi:hypothetical protein